MSASASRARFAAARTRSLLPEMSPTVGFNWAMAIFISVNQKRHAIGTGVGGSIQATRLGLNRDGVNEGNAAVALGDSPDGMLPADFGTDIFGNPRLTRNHIALTVETGREHGFGRRHTEIEPVEDYLQNRGDDPR